MLAVWACLAVPSDARQSAAPAGQAGRDADPITCWWRTDRNAVHVGEQFTLALTCALRDTSEARVVADRDRLDPAAIDLTPFEIVGGTRHDDIEAPPRRYFQYSYTLRLFGDEHFGRDVDIPSIPITYNIETSGVSATRGRDQLYLLPALPVRMLSLVPITATDIQDAPPDTFGDIDRRAVRATGELAAAGVLLTLAVALAGVAVVRVARPRLAGPAAERGLLSRAETVRGCLREAIRLKADVARVGWTDDLIGEALTLLRIAGALALGRLVAQRSVSGSEAAEDGQLAIRKGALSTKRVLLSGAATSAAVAANPALQDLAAALRAFEAARYSRTTPRIESMARTPGVIAGLDASLDSAIEMLQRMHAKHQWPARTVDALSRARNRMRAVWDR